MPGLVGPRRRAAALVRSKRLVRRRVERALVLGFQVSGFDLGANFLEELGWYDPTKKTDNYKLDLAKAEAWLAKGAQPSETVASLIKKSRAAAASTVAAAAVQ